MNLLIVESPTKAKTLSKFLGSGFDVVATTGHIMDLPKSRLSIDVEHDFKPLYEMVAKREGTIKEIIASAKKAKEVYLATDPDREGEAISSHVFDLIREKGKKDKDEIKRITFHEITKEAVEEAIKNPKKIDGNLVDAQIARRVLDRLVGYSLSPVLWKKVRRGLSAGRVQSVAVRLIVEKEREIEKFKPEEYWEIYSLLRRKGGKKEELTVFLVKEEVKDKKRAEGILSDLNKSDYKVIDVRKKQVTKSPYPPFTTSTMQQAGARLFSWSSKKTMMLAQKLYEEGLISYHRTDSTFIAISALEKARKYIVQEYGEKYLPEKARFFKNKSKNAQEAHEAIRPTNVGDAGNLKDGLHNDEKKLYDLIWKRFVASQMTPAIYSETAIDVEAKSKGRIHLMRASGQIISFDGWRKLFSRNEEGIVLPEVEIAENLDFIKAWGDQKFTQPPARFNEASLIKTLEKLGIGRPSTYAPIISTIQIRNYVEKKEGKFFPTSIGVAANDFLVANFKENLDYDFTAEMEDDLDKVAEGKLSWVKTIGDFFKPFEKKVKDVTKNAKRVKIEVEKLGKKCPDCEKGELVIRTGRFGKFISCSTFPDCKHTEKYLEKVGVKCPDCKEGDVIIKKSGRGRKFFGCSRYPDCKFATWKLPKKE